MAERDKHLFLATLADQANHYPDMLKEWKEVIILGKLTITERQSFADGFQGQMDRKLMAWRKLRATEREQEIEGNEDNLRHTRDYMVALATSISKICGDVIDILLEYLIPTPVVAWEPIVFYHTMRGDYYRYLAEVKTGEERRAAADEAKVAYEFATGEAVELSPSHPTRLRLAICFSDFYSEILNLKTSAYTLAKDALDDALQGEGTMKLMQLLHEKIAELARAQPGVGQNLLDGP